MSFTKQFIINISILSILSFPLTSFSEIIIDADGNELSGRISGFSQNGLQFVGEQYVVIPLDSIRDVRIDGDAEGEELRRQQANIDRASRVIDSEKYVVRDLGRKIRGMLENAHYDELDKVEDDFLTNQVRGDFGNWRLHYFYYGLISDISSRDVTAFEKRIKQLEAWLKAKPDSIAAKIGLMGALNELAWAARGGGYSNTVTDKGVKQFKRALKRALDIGNALRSENVRNPALYTELIISGNGYGIPKDELKTLARESATLQPLYYAPYARVMYALLPRWGGARGEVEAFANWVAQITGTPADLDLYYRLIRYLKTEIKDRRYRYYQFDWEKIQQGFAEYQQNYRALDEDFHFMAKIACLHGDREAAKKYFQLVDGEWNHFAKSVWGKPDLLKVFKRWSEEDPSPDFKELLLATLNKEFPKLARLIKRYTKPDFNINRTDVYGSTLLHLLIEAGQGEIVAYVVELGADLDLVNGDGLSPLHLAARFDRTEIIEMLLLHGADIYSETTHGNTAAHFAAKNGFTMSLDTLLQKNRSLIRVKNNNGYTPLHSAALEGQISSVELLLKYPEAKHELYMSKGTSPLMLAVLRGHFDVVRTLVQAGADLNSSNQDGHTPLSLAREKGYLDIVSYLQSKHAGDSARGVTAEAKKNAIKLYEEASRYNSKKDYPKAKALYLKSLEYNPNYYLAYHSLALGAWQFEQDSEKADQYIDQSIELNPGYVENYYLKGRINQTLNRPKIYKPLFIKYVELAPDTLNTKDLKQNYAQFLTIEPGNAIKNDNVAGMDHNLIYGLLGVLGILMLLIIWRRRVIHPKE